MRLDELITPIDIITAAESDPSCRAERVDRLKHSFGMIAKEVSSGLYPADDAQAAECYSTMLTTIALIDIALQFKYPE